MLQRTAKFHKTIMSTATVLRSTHPSLQSKNGRLRSLFATRATPESLSVFSPSKINLFLRIIRRRPDGYHDLASLFHVIDLGDSMTFTPIDNDRDNLICNIPDIPTDDSNLVIRALNLYRSKTGVQQFFEVGLKKLVPHGAGLGGGSANAATTLWAANQICGNVRFQFFNHACCVFCRLPQMMICSHGLVTLVLTFQCSFPREQHIALVRIEESLYFLRGPRSR